MIKQFFKRKKFITLSSLFFLQSLKAQGRFPVPGPPDRTILPIDQYSILLIVLLVLIGVWLIRKHIIVKDTFN